VPREWLDALDDLPKQRQCQVTSSELQLQSEVPGVPDEAAARLDEPLLEARQ
jgi:hypothetical protein